MNPFPKIAQKSAQFYPKNRKCSDGILTPLPMKSESILLKNMEHLLIAEYREQKNNNGRMIEDVMCSSFRSLK